MTDTSSPAIRAVDLAALVAGKLCHDFISPAGAITSGLDLLKDPSAQDMRDDALALIEQSASKMVALVHFARVAFGASTTAERFSTDAIRTLADDLLAGGRAKLAWRLQASDLSKVQARALLNLAYVTVGALPSGGEALIEVAVEGGQVRLSGRATGARARLKPEAATGLAGDLLTDGLQGQWIQPYWLWLTVAEAGGRLAVETGEDQVALTCLMPA
ncbi:MAG: histidine phosphotransferase ChpT [Brevundimonas sp.]